MNRFVLPFQTILDANGDPVSGGKANFYITGTTTRQDTFTDSALSVAHANPVVADSAGRLAEIFLQDRDYNVIVTDAADVQIGAHDPVRPAATRGKGGDIASATALVIDTDGKFFDVTGTTTVTSMTVAAGREFTLQFDGALILTHHATNLILPNGVSFTTAAGDTLLCFAHAANQVTILNHTRVAGSVTVQTFTASGTYTKPSGLVQAEVELVASGGGGGGAENAASRAGAGGAGGGYARELLAASDIGATETVTVGAGGAGGAAGNNAGVAGGTTSFGALLSATGGAAGAASSGGSGAAGNGGVGSGGDLNTSGADGFAGDGPSQLGGNGGGSFFGGGARGGLGNANGQNATGIGAGGGGGSSAGGGAAAGGNGADGIVIVREYY